MIILLTSALVAAGTAAGFAGSRASSRAIFTPGDKGGLDIDVTGTDTLNIGYYYNIDRFSLNGAPTISGSGLLKIKAGSIYINGTLNMAGRGVAGGNAGTASGGNGGAGGGSPVNGNASGGSGSTTTGGGGGGGGGYGGAGGAGGVDGGGSGGGGAGGTSFGTANLMRITYGRGGGGGGASNFVNGGSGGAGGGAVWLEATTKLQIGGTISCNGANGANGVSPTINNQDGGGGGGGGSGGGIMIIMCSSTNALVITGTLSAAGGNGGDGGSGSPNSNGDFGAGGGAGGGGRIKIFYNGQFTNSSTCNYNAGTNGTTLYLLGKGSAGAGGTGNGGTLFVRNILAAKLTIDSTATYRWPTATSNFLSGQSVLIKVTINHTWGASEISGATVSIFNTSSTQMVNNQPMIIDGTGSTWKRFKYTYTLAVPAARGQWRINITGTGTGSTDYIDFYFTVINQAPQIIGTIGPFNAVEDGSITPADLSSKKSDLEDSGNALTWSVSGFDTNLVQITVNINTLNFILQPDRFGNTQATLTLTDSDSATATKQFWVNVTGLNDNPYIQPKIPNQQKPEDTPDWTLALSAFENDLEDGSPSPNLTWTVTDIHSPLDVAKVYIDTSDVLHLGVIPNANGDEVITLNLTDSGGLSVSQQIFVNITPVNDPPEWKPVPDLNMTSESMQDVYNLTYYTSDIDSANLNYQVVSVSDPNFVVVIDKNLTLDVKVPTAYIGSALVNLSANDGAAAANVEFNIYAHFGLLETTLVSPSNGAKISKQTRQIIWSLNNPGDLKNVVFDIYFKDDLSLVADLDPDSRIVSEHTKTSYNVSNLHNGSTYYWTVIPRAPAINFDGSCTSGVWSFTLDISTTNAAPTTELIFPQYNETITTKDVVLRWSGADPNGDYPLYYDVFLATADKMSLVESHDISVRVGQGLTVWQFSALALKEDSLYYWTVLPSDGALTGTCLNGTWPFLVNSENYAPEVMLKSPENNDFVGKDVILRWVSIDQDMYDIVTFEVYLDQDRSKVENKSTEARKTIDNFRNHMLELTDLEDGKKYYWWVIPYDSKTTGTCLSGIWTFNVNKEIVNTPPIVTLESPKEGAVIYTSSVDLVWSGFDADDDKITYDLYFSDDKDLVGIQDNSALKFYGITEEIYSLSGLEPGKYYWTIIPNDGDAEGFCKSGVWSFTLEIIDEDRDSDGMPNSWEELYELDPDDAADADDDPDGDGFTNLQEYENLTNPKDPNSHPEIPDTNGDGNTNHVDKEGDNTMMFLAIIIIIIIIMLVILVVVFRNRRLAREKAEKALAESAEYLAAVESRKPSPYSGEEGHDIPEDFPYEDPEDMEEPVEEELREFPLAQRYVRGEKADEKESDDTSPTSSVPVEETTAPPAAAVPVPVPKPAPKPSAVETDITSGSVPEPGSKDAVIADFEKYLKIDKKLAKAIYGVGFISLKKLKDASMDDILEVKGIDLTRAASLRLAIANIPTAALVEKAAVKPVGKTPVPTTVPKPVAKPTPTPVPKPVVSEPVEEDEEKTCGSCGFPLEAGDKVCPICENPVE